MHAYLNAISNSLSRSLTVALLGGWQLSGWLLLFIGMVDFEETKAKIRKCPSDLSVPRVRSGSRHSQAQMIQLTCECALSEYVELHRRHAWLCSYDLSRAFLGTELRDSLCIFVLPLLRD